MAVEIAHSFILDLLLDSRLAREVRVNPMFGSHAIYVGDRIVFITRQREKSPRDNGVWVVVQPDFRAEIRKLFKALRPIELFSTMKQGGPTWLCLPETAKTFETDVTRIAELVIGGDERFGKVPKSKAPKRPSARRSKPRPKRT